MKTEREKIIDIIQKSVDGCSEYWAGLIADGLLENGVFVPPKVGSSVFYISAVGRICEAKIIPNGTEFYGMVYMDDGSELMGSWFNSKEIGKTVFLSREDAEAALKAREKDD